MGRPKGIKNTPIHIWSNEEKEYLAEITPGHHYTEIQELVNEKFKLDLTLNQIKGLKGVCAKGSEKTWFKKGHEPVNHREVGSERITKDGYVEIKIAEPDKWRLKHLAIWEQQNGPIPPKHALIFADGDKTNISIDNLLLVTREQLLTMNRNKLIKNNLEATKTGVLIAKVLIKANERRKKSK